CVIISNDLLNSSNTISWVMPITSRSKRFPSDIPLKTKNNKVTGIIDTVQIRAIDLSVRDTKIVDTLQEQLKHQLLRSIAAHTEVISKYRWRMKILSADFLFPIKSFSVSII